MNSFQEIKEKLRFWSLTIWYKSYFFATFQVSSIFKKQQKDKFSYVFAFQEKHEKQWYLQGLLWTFATYVWIVWNMLCEVCLLQVNHQLWIMRTLRSTAVERKKCAGKSWSYITNQHPRKSKPRIEVAVGPAQQQIRPRIPIAVRASIVASDCCRFEFCFVLPVSLWLHACSKRQCVFFMFAACAIFSKFPRKKRWYNAALTQMAQNLRGWRIVAYSANILKAMVALCGA